MSDADSYDELVTQIADAAWDCGYKLVFVGHPEGWEAIYMRREAARRTTFAGSEIAPTRTEAAKRALAAIQARAAA